MTRKLYKWGAPKRQYLAKSLLAWLPPYNGALDQKDSVGPFSRFMLSEHDVYFSGLSVLVSGGGWYRNYKSSKFFVAELFSSAAIVMPIISFTAGTKKTSLLHFPEALLSCFHHRLSGRTREGSGLTSPAAINVML